MDMQITVNKRRDSFPKDDVEIQTLRVFPGEYEHFKGKRYFVHYVEDDLVFYEALYSAEPHPFYTRPVEEFFDTKEINGVKKPRFRRIKNENQVVALFKS